jgi:hypothetical protein
MVRYSELSFEEKSKIIPRYDDPRFDEFMNNYFEIMSDARDVTPVFRAGKSGVCSGRIKVILGH